MNARTLFLCLGLIMGISSTVPAADDVSALMKFIPDNANTICVIKVQDLYDSPRGKAEQWQQKHQSKFLAGSVDVPPGSEIVLRACDFSLEQSFIIEAWTVASWKDPVPMQKVVERTKGKLDRMLNKRLILSGQDRLIVEWNPQILGAIHPASRQHMARWIQDSKTTGDTKPSYIQECVDQMSGQVLAAIDLSNAPETNVLRERLKQSTIFQGDKEAIDPVVRVIESIRGARLAVTESRVSQATLTIDFGVNIGDHPAKYLKAVLIEFLAGLGMQIDELVNAQAQIKGKSMSLAFEMPDDVLRQVMSLFQWGNHMTEEGAQGGQVPSTGNQEQSNPKNAEALMVINSQRYYQEVNRLMDDLWKRQKNADTYNQSATWHDNYARRIEQMPIGNVDPAMAAYGAKVAQTFRSLAGSLRGVPLDVGVLQQSRKAEVNYYPGGYGYPGSYFGGYGAGYYGYRPYGVFGGYGGYGGYGGWGSAYTPGQYRVDTNSVEVNTKQAQAIAQDKEKRDGVWQQMRQDRQTIRQQMQQKYNKDFETPYE